MGPLVPPDYAERLDKGKKVRVDNTDRNVARSQQGQQPRTTNVRSNSVPSRTYQPSADEEWWPDDIVDDTPLTGNYQPRQGASVPLGTSQHDFQAARQAPASEFSQESLYKDPDEVHKERMARKIVNTIKAVLREPAVVISVVALLFIILFMRAFLVPSGSMNPTLMEGDRIMSIARYFPNGHTYERGDIVCFTAPDGTVYVKRVIGVGGDHIQISGETVFVNGEPSRWQGTGGVITSTEVQLADDEYWVMGDNRGNSQDSRFIGPVKASQMISKVYGIYFPFDRAKLF